MPSVIINHLAVIGIFGSTLHQVDRGFQRSDTSSIRMKRVNARELCPTAKSEWGTTQPTTIDLHSSVDFKPPDEAYVRVVVALMGLGETP